MEQQNQEIKPKRKRGCFEKVLIGFVAFIFVGGVLSFIFDDGKHEKSAPYVENYSDGSTVHKNIAKMHLVKHLKRNVLKDPDSYQEDEYGIVFEEDTKLYWIRINYRAKNSFGGYVRGVIDGKVRLKSTNEYEIVSLEMN